MKQMCYTDDRKHDIWSTVHETFIQHPHDAFMESHDKRWNVRNQNILIQYRVLTNTSKFRYPSSSIIYHLSCSLSTIWSRICKRRGILFRYFIFHWSTASQTSWREYFYSQSIESQNKQCSFPLTKPCYFITLNLKKEHLKFH